MMNQPPYQGGGGGATAAIQSVPLSTLSGGGSGSSGSSSGGMARVTFRVRCESLGYGESVYLQPIAPGLGGALATAAAGGATSAAGGGPGQPQGRMVPLYTTATSYPWYTSRSPTSLALPSDPHAQHQPHQPGHPHQQMGTIGMPRPGGAGAGGDQYYTYRYAVFRSGVFHRWEDPTDGPPPSGELDEDSDVTMGGANKTQGTQGGARTAGEAAAISPPHRLPLRLLAPDELYTVSDVLGRPTGQPQIEHIRVRTGPVLGTLGSLHSRQDSRSRNSLASLGSKGANKSSGALDRKASEKKVGFAPQPVPYRSPGADSSSRLGGGATKDRSRQVHLNSTDGLVVASAFLPVHLHRTEQTDPTTGQIQVSWSADWDYEALLSMQTHLRVTRVGVVKWRGWHGNYGDGGSPAQGGVPVEEREKVEKCLERFNCVPVWVEPTLFGEMYNGFCKGVLWPILHNVTSVYSSRPQGSAGGGGAHPAPASNVNPDNPGSANEFSEYCMDDVAQGPIHGDGGREAALWSAYTAVNRQFADVIVQCFNEGDLIWIHGFHLLILPSFLTRRIPMAKIGIFLHTPFPSSEIFRTVWCREDLLRGMLNADQVGFHLFEYARHFLTCCRRLLGLNYGMIPDESGGHNLAIDTNGRHVTVTSIHAGVEPPVLNQVLNHASTMERAFAIRNQFRGKVIFCAIDRMESLKGIPLKMLGLERFLNRCPEWVGKIVLVQVGISAYERGDDFFRTKAEVLSLVENINRTWPGTVQFQECSESEMRLQQRMALLRAADVVMVTPIRDGLNLIPLEFTIAHQDALTDQGRLDGRRRGLCILSEFSSCTRVMRGALHVNPWKISEIANAFHQALNMSEDERMRRISCASEFVTRVTTQRWALAVMLDLKGVHKNVDAGQYAGAGLGLGFRLLGMETGFVSLDVTKVAKSFKNARCRLILLDYGGTILSNDNVDNLTRFQMVKKTREASLPTERLISTLKDLCADKRNIVFVVSGKERHSLTSTLGGVPNLGLAAEHGMFVSWPTPKSRSKRRWETIVPDQDRAWRSIAITIMEVYTSRTHGSYIEETEMKVLWQYRDADPEFGYLQSRELEDHLSNVLRSFSVDILHGGVEEGGYVEVRPKGVNKGVVAMHVVKHIPKISTHSKIDFALVLGDDHCDEPMLSVMRQVGRRAVEARIASTGGEPLAPLPATITQVDVSPCDGYISSDLSMFTCTVGKKPSAAANYVNDVDEVHELLESLVKVATRDHKYFSSVDLRSMSADGAGRVVQQTQHDSWLTPVAAAGGGGGFTRSMSLGEMHGSDEPIMSDSVRSQPLRVSANLNEFLGTIEDEEDDDAVFF